jgi:hypothetical protein
MQAKHAGIEAPWGPTLTLGGRFDLLLAVIRWLEQPRWIFAVDVGGSHVSFSTFLASRNAVPCFQYLLIKASFAKRRLFTNFGIRRICIRSQLSVRTYSLIHGAITVKCSLCARGYMYIRTLPLRMEREGSS